MLPVKEEERRGASDTLFENRKEFDSFYHREAPKLLQFLKRRIWIEEERADLVQEAFTRLVAARSAAARENPGSYVQGILRHLLADRARSWSRAKAARLDEVEIVQTPEQPDAALEVAQLQMQYRAAVEMLPPRTREVFLLHRVEDLPYRLIAERMGISIRTVEWHMAQAVVRIGRSLSSHD
ncbi:RNA polymerase sigma factor [Novosphingobium lindaniclasticum]